jgi:hypothetical protein
VHTSTRTLFELSLVYISSVQYVDQTFSTVYLCGPCPVGAGAIEMYRRQRGADATQWVDVSHCAEPALGAGLTGTSAMARLHVLRANGSGYVEMPVHPLVIASPGQIHRASRRLVPPVRGVANSFAGVGPKVSPFTSFSNH